MVVSNVVDYRQREKYAWIPHAGDALTEAADVVGKARFLHGELESERSRLQNIDLWYRGRQETPTVLRPTREMQRLLDLSRTPWLSLVVSTVAQALFVDGYKSPAGRGVDPVWGIWNANRMNAHQSVIHRAALGYGYCYAIAEKVDPSVIQGGVKLRGVSPKRCFAVYSDPVSDEWPVYAVELKRLESGSALVLLYDSAFVHTIRVDGDEWGLVSTVPHGADHVPIVRYVNQIDIDGQTPGEVEPFIGIAARVDKTMFDRMLVQHYNSWKKIWVAGLERPEGKTDAELEAAKLRLKQDDFIMFSDVDTRIGAIDETSLEGFIKAIESDVEQIAVLSQLNHLLTGHLSNLSVDTLVQANRPLTQKVFERQVSFGESHEQLLRLTARLAGHDEVADDLLAHVTWQETEARSLAQAADALGKTATMLGVPKVALWRMLPGVTEAQASEWEQLLVSDDPVERILASQVTSSGFVPPLDRVDDDSGSE